MNTASASAALRIVRRDTLRFCSESDKEALIAAEKGQLDRLRSLLRNGANVNAKDFKGNTLLAKAVAFPTCVDFLIQSGAEVNRADGQDSSPLLKAAAQGQNVSVQVLLKAEPFINARNKFGSTALIEAARHERPRCVELLIGRGAHINLVDKGGYSALVHAAARRAKECVWILLQAGIIIDRNIFESMYCLLNTWDSATADKQIILMLFAGGADRPRRNHSEASIYWRNLSECLVPFCDLDENISLKQLCRSAIRKHAAACSPKNLYHSLSQLGLPLILFSYLLYNIV